MYKDVSAETYSLLQSAKLEADIYLPKEDKSFYNYQDFSIESTDPLKLAQEAAFSKGKELLGARIDFSMVFDFFELINLNNYFLHKGYNIVVDQEDSFFDIIKSGDDEVKAKLKEFLELQNQLSKHQHWYKKFKDFDSDIKRSKDTKEVDKHLKTFLSLFS